MPDRYSDEYQLVTIPVKVNKVIKEVLDEYDKFRLPRKLLMKDYLAIIGDPNVQEAFNPWSYKCKGIEKLEIESGLSKAETAFNFSAMKLVNQKPTDVIKAAFYKKRNDSAFECGFLLDEFARELDGKTSIIVNPSPDMILNFEERRAGNSYVIVDQTIGELYKIQFPKANFYCIKDEPMKSFERMLVVNRDYPINETEVLLKWIQWCDGKVMALLPNAYLDNLKYNALSLIGNAGFAIEKVLALDANMTVTTPRKKCLIYMMKDSMQVERWKLENTIVNKKKFKILDKEIYVEHEFYWKSDITLNKLWNNIGVVEQKDTKSSEVKEFAFSKEIHLSYAVYENRKNRYAGTCWYRKIKNVDPLLYGKRISPIIEKGLRAKKKEEVIANLSQIVFDERVYPYIYTDMVEWFINAGEPVSLKTLWFVMRNTLLTNRNYDDNTMSELFELGGKELGEYNAMEQTEEELINLLITKLQVKEIPAKYLIQLNLLFTAARKEKLIRYNPLQEIINSVQKRASERQQEVRDVLTKKHFSATEEKRIFDYLTKNTWNEMLKIQLPKCVENSMQLLSLIRLFTGMSLREVCALRWLDFVQIEGTKEYQFKVSKFIDLKGKVISHASNEDWNKFRCVPVARPLRILLLQRKDYLSTNGISSKNLENMPIITATEDITSLKKSDKLTFCKPSNAQNFCRKALQHAGIERQELVLPDAKGELLTDICKYGGDIFITNIKMRLNHECGMTLGEISYMLGVKGNDTLSQHYCDYSNSLIQYAMVEKMNRWTSEYESIIRDLQETQIKMGNLKNSTQKILSGPYKQKCVSFEMILSSNSDSDCKITLQISAMHEPIIEINKYGGE